MNAPPPLMPQRSDYYQTVRAFLPGVDDDELDVRASLLLMRDKCLAAKRRATEHGWTILNLVETLATEHALGSIRGQDLAEIRRVCIRLVSCASDLDAVFSPPLPLQPPPAEAA